MLSPEQPSTIGMFGALVTAVNTATGGPPAITYVVGLLTAAFYALKIIGWFLDRFGKHKKKD